MTPEKLLGVDISSLSTNEVSCISTGPNDAGTHEACKYTVDIDGRKIYAITIDGTIKNVTYNRNAANFFYSDAIDTVDNM